MIPVAFANNRLTLAMVNPNNILALDDVRRIIKGVMIEPVVTTEDDYRKFMSTTYTELMPKDKPASTGDKMQTIVKSSAEMVDLLQSELIRDLQLTEDAGVSMGD